MSQPCIGKVFPKCRLIRRIYRHKLPQLLIDPEQLRRAVLNLAANAVAAMEENQGSKTLQFRTSFMDDLNAVRVEVSDNGCGISDEQKLRFFDPYFSPKRMEWSRIIYRAADCLLIMVVMCD